MKIITRDCFYFQGVLALLDEMNIEYTDQEILLADGTIIPFFIFPRRNAFDIYKYVVRQRIRSPALVFCARHMIPFLKDIYFSEVLYFISLDEKCKAIKVAIQSAVTRYQRKEGTKTSNISPYQLLSNYEVNVLSYLMKGYAPSIISTVTDLPFRHISLFKRSAMRKLNASTFYELYFKVRLLESFGQVQVQPGNTGGAE